MSAALADKALICDSCPSHTAANRRPDSYELAGCYALLCKVIYPEATRGQKPGDLIQKYLDYANRPRQACYRQDGVYTVL